MSGFGFSLAKAHIELLAKTQEANAALDATAAKVDALIMKGTKGGEGGDGDFFAGATKGARRLKATIGQLLIPAAVFAGLERLIGLFEDGVRSAERMKSAGQDAFISFQQSVLQLTTDPEVLALTSRRMQESAKVQLEALERQKEQLEGFGAALKGTWGLIWGGPTKAEIEQSLAEKGADIQSLLTAQLKPILETEAKLREEAATRQAEAYHKQLGEEWKAEEELRRKRREAREQEVQEELDLAEGELQRRIRLLEQWEEEARRAHDDELRRIRERTDAETQALERIAELTRRIREEQERGFGISDITFGSTDAATVALRALNGRGNGRR